MKPKQKRLYVKRQAKLAAEEAKASNPIDNSVAQENLKKALAEETAKKEEAKAPEPEVVIEEPVVQKRKDAPKKIAKSKTSPRRKTSSS